MEIKICRNRTEWDNWLLKQGQNEFLQSWDWGEFQAWTGKPAVRLQAVEGGDVVWQGQGFEHRLGLGMRYLYLPKFSIFPNKVRDPAFHRDNLQFSIIVDFIRKYNFSFLRIEPLVKLQIQNYRFQITQNRQPQTTLVLDLNRTEPELLARMHSKTRYNIRLAERNNIFISKEKSIDAFWKLNKETAARDRFKSHDDDYYQKMLELNCTRQLTAYYADRPVASNILVAFGDTVTYLHGASSDAFRNLMAPHLLQWHGIELGKSLGCRYYDFWGIAPAAGSGEPSACFHGICWRAGHQWTGITRFKAGFGGEVRGYPQATDVVLNRFKYSLYKFVSKICRSTRNFF